MLPYQFCIFFWIKDFKQVPVFTSYTWRLGTPAAPSLPAAINRQRWYLWPLQSSLSRFPPSLMHIIKCLNEHLGGSRMLARLVLLLPCYYSYLSTYNMPPSLIFNLPKPEFFYRTLFYLKLGWWRPVGEIVELLLPEGEIHTIPSDHPK